MRKRDEFKDEDEGEKKKEEREEDGEFSLLYGRPFEVSCTFKAFQSWNQISVLN